VTGTSAIADTTLRARVRRVSVAAERIVAVELEGPDGQPLPSWRPGAHIDVALADGIVRQYSLCSRPGAPSWRLAVLEEESGRGGSQLVHQLRVGDVLRVSAPRNNFSLELGSRRVVFVSGGIGVTPILPMIHAAADAGVDWRMVKLSRSPQSAAFTDEVAQYGHRVHHHFDSIAGTLDLEETLDAIGGDEADVYACGPGGLLSALESYASSRAGCVLRVERFSGVPNAALRPGDHSFVVETADGTEIEVRADQTILDAVTAAGIPMLSSCQEGICGTCETPVLEGVPDHRDQLLSEEERASGEMMMPCVSRCIGTRITLDL
jgi:ferredoxin-NADP reductase